DVRDDVHRGHLLARLRRDLDLHLQRRDLRRGDHVRLLWLALVLALVDGSCVVAPTFACNADVECGDAHLACVDGACVTAGEGAAGEGEGGEGEGAEGEGEGEGDGEGEGERGEGEGEGGEGEGEG